MPSKPMFENPESLYLTYIAYLELTRSEFDTLRCFISWRLSQFSELTNVDVFDVLHEIVLRSRKAQEKQIIENRLAFYKGIAQNAIREMDRKERRSISCSLDHLEGTSTAIAVEVEIEDETISLNAGNFSQVQLRQAMRRLPPDQYALLELRYMRGLRWREISRLLEQRHGKKVSEAALRHRHQTAKVALRKEVLKICQGQ